MKIDLSRPWIAVWYRRHADSGLLLPLAVGTAAVLVTLLVYLTGGTRFVYAHAAYLPIVLAGISLGPIAGVLTGLALGIALGPWMPLDTVSLSYQSFQNWGLRCVFFIVIGGLTGLLALRVRNNAEENLHLQSFDPVTGLPNRAALERRLEELRAEGAGGWCLVIVRLNTLGRMIEALAPDQTQTLWHQVVERLRRSWPPGSEAFRIHADQIALLVPREQEAATEAARDLIASLRPPVPVGDIPLELDATAGIAPLGSRGEAGEADLAPVLTASLASTQAQQLGHDVHARPPEEAQELRRRLRRLGELPQAIAERQLEMHYQPKILLASGRVLGAEALIRWRHPREGLLLPGAFLPMVEQTRLIDPVTWHALDIVGRAAAAWQDEGRRLKLAVNLSVRNLGSHEVVERLQALLLDYALSPEALEVEVTESAIMAAPEEATIRLQEIANLGIGVAIDDFGAGHSSLAYLTRFPADTLKFDRGLIRSLAENERSRQVLATMAELALRLGMATVAEGVEDERTLDLVRRIGLTQVQGFLVARPMPEAEFLAWHAANPRPLVPTD